MSNTPAHLKYAKSDEWFDEATGQVGISDYAQGQLSDKDNLCAFESVGSGFKSWLGHYLLLLDFRWCRFVYAAVALE